MKNTQARMKNTLGNGMKNTQAGMKYTLGKGLAMNDIHFIPVVFSYHLFSSDFVFVHQLTSFLFIIPQRFHLIESFSEYLILSSSAFIEITNLINRCKVL